MTYDEIIAEVAKSTGLTRHIVDRTYRAYWKTVRSYITSLPLKEDLTDEEFLKLRPNINIPSIGKLYVTLDRYKRMRKVHKEFLKKGDNAINDVAQDKLN